MELSLPRLPSHADVIKDAIPKLNLQIRHWHDPGSCYANQLESHMQNKMAWVALQFDWSWYCTYNLQAQTNLPAIQVLIAGNWGRRGIVHFLFNLHTANKSQNICYKRVLKKAKEGEHAQQIHERKISKWSCTGFASSQVLRTALTNCQVYNPVSLISFPPQTHFLTIGSFGPFHLTVNILELDNPVGSRVWQCFEN